MARVRSDEGFVQDESGALEPRFQIPERPLVPTLPGREPTLAGVGKIGLRPFDFPHPRRRRRASGLRLWTDPRVPFEARGRPA